MSQISKLNKLVVLVLVGILINFLGIGQIQGKDYAAMQSARLEPTCKIIYKHVDDKDLYLHVFEPRGYKPTDKRPCFLAIHGGAWGGGEPRRFYSIVNEFVKKGMVGISLQYRLMKNGETTTVFDCVKDGRSAVRYIRQHAAELGIDPQKIIVSGGSAGAHVASGTAMFSGTDDATDDASISCMPDALVLYYPVIDTSPEGYGNKTIGPRWRELSPLHQVRAGLPPTIIFHGTGDTVTPYQGAKAFQEAMQKAGNRCELVSNEGGIHGYMMFEKKFYQEAMKKTALFLKSLKYLK